MAKYELLAECVILGAVQPAGTIVEYDGVSEGDPGPNMRLIEDEKPDKIKIIKE